MKPIENEGVIGDVELTVVQCDKLVAWIYAGVCPILFLSILCSCWWWIVAGDASVTHTHSGICHVFVFTFIYFPWFFSTLQFVWEKMGRCAHTACPSSHVCCVHWKRVGDVFFFFFSSREIGNPMNTVFPLLWATVLLTTFIYGHLVFLYWKECRWLEWVLQYPSYVQNVFDTWLFHTFYFFACQ